MALRDQPYLPLYIQDFLTDEKLIECSPSATGIYIRIMCIMHKSDTYGTILLKQKDKQNDRNIKNFASKLVKSLPWKEDVIFSGLNELLSEGVLIIDGDKLIQKRMVRDNDLSIKRSIAGSKGGSNSQFAKAKNQAKHQANTENENDNAIVNDINIGFEEFWNAYDKKRGDKTKLEKKWKSLNDSDRDEIMQYIPKYKAATPDKKFRKDPDTFLNNHSWKDEIITYNANNRGNNTRSIKRINDHWN